MTLQLLHSEFPYILGKFDFLFISAVTIFFITNFWWRWMKNNIWIHIRHIFKSSFDYNVLERIPWTAKSKRLFTIFQCEKTTYLPPKSWESEVKEGWTGQTVHKLKKPSTQSTNCIKLGTPSLKVPKREIFVTELFILSDPIWVGDLRTEPKKPFV
jgi:hypothetical protein